LMRRAFRCNCSAFTRRAGTSKVPSKNKEDQALAEQAWAG
jgi:hypothetical protein